MKKDHTKLRIGVLVVTLLLILAIGAAAGTTYAKYVSSISVSSKSATITKFGYTLTVGTENLFSNQYGDVSDNFASASSTNVVVKASSDSGKIVAPGTYYKGIGGTEATMLTIYGSAAVSAQLIIDVSNFNTIVLKDRTESVADYYPVRWTVNGTEWKGSDHVADGTDFAELIKAALESDTNAAWATSDSVSAANGIVTVDIPANTPIRYELKIGWSWSYTTDRNAEDTILGYLAGDVYPETYRYGSTTYTLNNFTDSVTAISFTLAASVVQTQ